MLLDRLNLDAEIAFIVSAGPGEWRAIRTTGQLSQGRHCLWHVPSGPLPLFGSDSVVDDPFAGWSELRSGADSSIPYFGAAHPGTIWLNLRQDAPSIGLSSFEWIGNHYGSIGLSADVSTERWWKRLRAWIKRNAELVPRGGPTTGGAPEVWAMHGAGARIASDAPADVNP